MQQRKLWKQLKELVEAFQSENGREPAIEEIAKELGLEPEEIVLSMEAVVEVESMDQGIFAAA